MHNNYDVLVVTSERDGKSGKEIHKRTNKKK